MNFKNSYVTLDSRLYHRQPPTPLDNPKAGHFNPIVAKQIGWDTDESLMKNWVAILAGHQVPDGFDPLAMAYAGHQFGQWAGQLGDGRGLLMAQVLDTSNNLTDLHLKGSGLTPYSRMGDGRAVLRSTIREYLCGHAMSSLGINSSNALGFITSKTKVRRETLESGAALMRVADSHIRLGHLEWVANFAPDLLDSFTHYMIDTYYPEISDSRTPILDFIAAVSERTAIMIANWQLIGFAHGVMNTDNLSITGSTIDYGPFGFLERFDPTWINNHSDYTGRYTYQNQPAIGHWNLNVWAMNFLRLSANDTNKADSGASESRHKHDVDKESVDKESIDKRLTDYERIFMTHYQQGLCRKLGLSWPDDTQFTNNNLIADTINITLKLAFEFLEIIEENKLDYTNSFRSLSAIIDAQNSATHELQLLETIKHELEPQALHRFEKWQTDYTAHVDSQIENGMLSHQSKVVETLKATNPVYVLRNAMAQKAIDMAQAQDFSEVDRLFNLLRHPYNVQEDIATMADTAPPDRNDAPIIVSCSS